MGLRQALRARQQKKTHARYVQERERQAELNREDAQQRVKDVANKTGPFVFPFGRRNPGAGTFRARARDTRRTRHHGRASARGVVERQEQPRQRGGLPFVPSIAHDDPHSPRKSSLLREELRLAGSGKPRSTIFL